MKKIIFYILFFLIKINLYSQINNNHATYKLSFNTENIKNTTETINNGLKLFDDLNEVSNNIKFNLNFSSNESLFYINTKLEVDNNTNLNNLAVVISGGKGIFYNTLNERIRQVNGFGDLFLINYDLIKKTDWILKEDKRIINGFECKKAVIKEGKDNYSKVVAWYCPKIPFRFGPRGFNNLPGLIIELIITNRNKVIFTLSKLEINKDKIIIEKPIKGKKVTKDEFNQIGKDLMLKMKG